MTGRDITDEHCLSGSEFRGWSCGCHGFIVTFSRKLAVVTHTLSGTAEPSRASHKLETGSPQCRRDLTWRLPQEKVELKLLLGVESRQEAGPSSAPGQGAGPSSTGGRGRGLARLAGGGGA